MIENLHSLVDLVVPWPYIYESHVRMWGHQKVVGIKHVKGFAGMYCG